MSITETLAGVASQLATKGSASVPGLGKFSIRATQTRKGVRRKVVLKVEEAFEAQVRSNTAPDAATPAALVEAASGDEPLRIVGLGSFAIVDHPATTGVHPRTRRTFVVPARRALEFTGATLKK